MNSLNVGGDLFDGLSIWREEIHTLSVPLEAFKALEESALESKKADVKRWYDGFCFGECGSIYHPWSVTKF